MPKRGPESMVNLWNFGTCDFLFFAKSITLQSFFYMMRRPRITLKNYKISMQFRCLENVWKTIKTIPKWFQNCYKLGAQIQRKPSKHRSNKKIDLGIDFWRPLVPILLAKWSPTRRTTSRKPTKKTTTRTGNSQDSLPIQTCPRRRGEPPARSGLCRTVRHWDPLKTVPGAGFEKTCKINEKTIEQSMVFYGPKTLSSIEKQILF